jgi:hypothetical protein
LVGRLYCEAGVQLAKESQPGRDKQARESGKGGLRLVKPLHGTLAKIGFLLFAVKNQNTSKGDFRLLIASKRYRPLAED